MLKIAVVGVGAAGIRQTDAATELYGIVEVVCLVDTDRNYPDENCRKLGIRKMRLDIREVFEDDDIDAVPICTPHACGGIIGRTYHRLQRAKKSGRGSSGYESVKR